MEFRSCTQPWFEFQTLYRGVGRTCCYYRGNDIPLGASTVPELWNGDFFNGMRTLIASGDDRGSGCEGCPYVKYQEEPNFLFIPSYVSGERRKNWEAAIRHFQNGDVQVTTLPIKYYAQFGLACNLRCTMCDHPQRYQSGEADELDANALLSDPEALKLADSIHIIGGEPFLIPSSLRFLDGVLANQDLWDIGYDFYTNGVLVDKHMHKLRELEAVTLTVSIDSHGTYYESIRKRSSWERVSRNLEDFRRHGLRDGKPRWQVHISTVLMRSGLLGLPDLVSWCIDNNFPIQFVNIVSVRTQANDHEHIFNRPELLAEVPGWEAALQSAIDRLGAAGRDREQRRLETAYKELHAGLEKATVINGIKAERARAAKIVSRRNAWEPLFSYRGDEVYSKLNRHVYSQDGNQTVLHAIPEGVAYRPLTLLDHLSTNFIEIPKAGGQAWVRVRATWTHRDGGVLPIMDVQDDKFRLIDAADTASTPVNGGAGLQVERLVYVSDDVAQLRLRITSGNEGAQLPDSLEIDGLAAMELQPAGGDADRLSCQNL